ncbi:MAG TPA: hypothetical protein VFT38_19120, partial [Vicinamibacteria bacterium]|nr:hypothetical protein [Vicinamibacteria bacterium]
EGAYAQINELERWLTDDGQVVVKFWFHISQKEQRRRLRKMEKDPAERWKVEKEDWRRNRRYDRWVEAAEHMLALTDTPAAPWTIVAATDARWTRVKVFRTLVERMQAALDRRQQAPASVSRTQMAEVATRESRHRRAKEDLARARTVAQDAGLPLEDPAFFVSSGDEK